MKLNATVSLFNAAKLMTTQSILVTPGVESASNAYTTSKPNAYQITNHIFILFCFFFLPYVQVEIIEKKEKTLDSKTTTQNARRSRQREKSEIYSKASFNDQ